MQGRDHAGVAGRARPFTVAIVGRPNVGKSTLFNRLTGRRLALVDDTPGLTRDRREGRARLGNLRFAVFDTAGFEDAEGRSLEARMRRQTEKAVADADVALMLVDARAGITPLDSHFADLLRRDPGRPLITFYDHASGERVELSVTTYANWVAKACSLLVDEHGLERGDRLRLDLPPHWLGHVFLGAAWYAGLAVDLREDSPAPDAVVCGPDTLDRWAEHADDLPVLACSLLPLGVRFAEPVPAGVHDVGIEIWGQPDAFRPWDPSAPDDDAVLLADTTLTQADLWEAAAAGSLLSDGGRLLAVSNPASPPGFSTFTEPLLSGGSVVLVAHPDADRLDSTARDERVTAREEA